MAFGLQPIHLLVIVIVALVIFGPKRLPQLGRWIGKTFAEFRKGAREMADEFHEETAHQGGSSRTGTEGPACAPQQPQAPTAASPRTLCAACGAANDAGARFCGQCGQRLGGEGAGSV